MKWEDSIYTFFAIVLLIRLSYNYNYNNFQYSFTGIEQTT